MTVGLKSLELGHSLRIFPQPPCTRLFEPFLEHAPVAAFDFSRTDWKPLL